METCFTCFLISPDDISDNQIHKLTITKIAQRGQGSQRPNPSLQWLAATAAGSGGGGGGGGLLRDVARCSCRLDVTGLVPLHEIMESIVKNDSEGRRQIEVLHLFRWFTHTHPTAVG